MSFVGTIEQTAGLMALLTESQTVEFEFWAQFEFWVVFSSEETTPPCRANGIAYCVSPKLLSLSFESSLSLGKFWLVFKIGETAAPRAMSFVGTTEQLWGWWHCWLCESQTTEFELWTQFELEFCIWMSMQMLSWSSESSWVEFKWVQLLFEFWVTIVWQCNCWVCADTTVRHNSQLNSSRSLLRVESEKYLEKEGYIRVANSTANRDSNSAVGNSLMSWDRGHDFCEELKPNSPLKLNS